MATLLVTYIGDTSSRFDRAYYTNHHLPLVSRTWDPHGLRGVEAYFWDGGEATNVPIAICLCHFANRDEIDAALAADECDGRHRQLHRRRADPLHHGTGRLDPSSTG
ncbi:EthD family reductase [Mycobacterium yunnanensis]|uniref:EthD family reductase n=1 Tax=Mycobacterium yunnanensis TaxID=368477 RepID=UPI0021F3711E|nr:EthD family reductase [Mycobacterium yunnanensis]